MALVDDHPGTDRVDPDPLRPEVAGHLLRHQDQPTLDALVDQRVACCEQAVDRGDVDDTATAAPRHLRDGILGAEVARLQPHGDRADPSPAPLT